MSTTARWLMDVPYDEHDSTAFSRALVARLVADGLPIWRASYALLTKHPEVLWRTVRHHDGAVTVDDQPHARIDDAFYRDSAVRVARESGTDVRVRLRTETEDAENALPYPICEDLRAQGGTDYLVQALPFANGEVSYASFATRAPGGFTDAQLAALEELRPFLARRLELESSYYATGALLDVYLGHNAAKRVRAGAIQRGKGELIDAAIWFSDMRGFTALSDRTPPAQVIAVLDRYFDAVASAVAASGGEVLKFIGDAVLAIFPIEDDARDACRRALAAAEAALDAVAKLDTDGVSIGIALHRGQVMYGNIGARDRLDFTVISAAVNEASRLESLCKQLATPLALSEAFTSAAQPDDVVDLGAHALKGVAAPLRVFTPRRRMTTLA